MNSLNHVQVCGEKKPRLLFLDTAYTLKMVKERELEQEYESRECGGYFEHVWGVHPIADIQEKCKLNYDGFKLSVVKFSEHQTIVEGVSAYYSVFKRIFPLNFLLSQIRFVAYLIALVKRERISVICSTDPLFCGLIGVLIRLFTGKPLVIWVLANHDDIYKATGVLGMPRLFRWRWVEKIVENVVFRSADLVAGGNQNNLEYALNNGAKLSKSTIFTNGKVIHRQHVKAPEERDRDVFFNTSPARHHFIYVGRLLELKHPDDVVRAFSVIDQNVTNCALIMAGDGPMLTDLEKLAEELGIADKVYFLGAISQQRLANLFAGCFAVLSPLTGRSLTEGALASIPIVAYDRDWQRDFVEASGAGIIVPFRGWQKMGEAAVHLLRHHDKARRMGEAARQRGLDACDLERLYRHERQEYEKLLKH